MLETLLKIAVIIVISRPNRYSVEELKLCISGAVYIQDEFEIQILYIYEN